MDLGHKLTLRELNALDETAFLAGLGIWEGEDLSRYTFDWVLGMTFHQLLERLAKNSAGINLPEGFVPSTIYYGFVGPDIVGRVHVRHVLNESLTHRGGHLGYAVAPRFRRKGCATEMVRQALPLCRGLGLQNLLLTCNDDNTPSWKIIEKFGGVLENLVWDPGCAKMARRYWLKL